MGRINREHNISDKEFTGSLIAASGIFVFLLLSLFVPLLTYILLIPCGIAMLYGTYVAGS